jgi:WhiB family redox-sensing transcriptional regulator
MTDARRAHEPEHVLDLAVGMSAVARQVIATVRTRYRTVTSNTRVMLLGTHGLCAQPDREPEAWFSDRSRGGQSRLRDRRDAARLCEGCPVVRECLEYAVATRQSYGVWGGMSERDRTVLTSAIRHTPQRAPSIAPELASARRSRISA